MKLTKEQVYVVIENQSDCDRAIQILTKANEPMWKDASAFEFDKDVRYLSIYNGDWFILDITLNKNQITLNQLELLLTPKIKKSELQKRIEVLEEKVAELISEDKKDINKPQFEVGKVYKSKSGIIFYCTEIRDSRLYGFGIGHDGKWYEDNRAENTHWSSETFTEATPEEWLKRLEEERIKRGFVKGVKVKPLWETPKDSWEVLTNTNTTRFENGCFFLSCCVMQDGKWAEIIEQPQYQAGTLGAFWDGDFKEAVSKRCAHLGILDSKTKSGQFVMQEINMCYQNFKPIKFD